jgi:hypothetical protein
MFQRLSSNAYQPSIFKDYTLNFCDLLKNNLTLIAATKIVQFAYPPVYEMFKEYIHPCPFVPVSIHYA